MRTMGLSDEDKTFKPEVKFVVLVEQPSEYIVHMEIREDRLKILSQEIYFRIKALDEITYGVSLEREKELPGSTVGNRRV